MGTIKTGDGSFTLYSSFFNENYHSLAGAKAESVKKFLLPSKVLDQNEIRIMDLGFGLGYNSFSLIEEALKNKKTLHIDAFELFKEPLEQSLDSHEPEFREILKGLLEKGSWSKEHVYLKLHWGDARKNVLNMKMGFYDAVFLDAFSPPKNPELWSLDFFRVLFKCLNEQGKVLTYSSALPVINAFIKAGFFVGYTPSFGRKRGGLMACKNPLDISYPLSDEDLYYICVSSRAIPNRDKGFWSKEQIQNYRDQLIKRAKSSNIRLSHKKAGKLLLKKEIFGI